MTKPTVEELAIEILDYDRHAGEDFDASELAEIIHALFNPVLKPLSEMANFEILEEITYCTEQTDILADRRLSLEREMFFRNNPDVTP